MVITYPAYSTPRGYDGDNDFVGRFARGLALGRDLRDNGEAGDLVSKLYEVIGQPNEGQQSAARASAALNPGRSLPEQSVQAAQGATDMVLLSELVKRYGGSSAPDVANDYVASVANSESGGDPTSRSASSSATGLFGFTDGTWRGLMSKFPQLGLTADGRTDPDQSRRAMDALTRENAAGLSKAGYAVTPTNLYVSHFLGAGSAPSILDAPDETPMSSLVGQDVLSANPSLSDMSVGEFKQWASAKATNSRGGYSGPSVGGGGQMPAPMRQIPRLSPDLIRALAANSQTRPLVLALIEQQLNSSTVDQWQQFKSADGSLLQMNMSSGEVKPVGGGSGVTVNTGDNTSKFSNKADELAAGRMSDYVSGGNDAANFIGDLKALTDLGKNIQTGKKTEILNALGPYAEALGVDIANLEDSQAYDAIVSRMAPAMRIPGSGGSSDFDARQFLKSLPSLGNTPEGNRIINETFQGIQERKIAAAGIAQQALANQITWQEADKQIAALGDPYTAFNDFRKRSETAKSAGAPKPGDIVDGYRFRGGDPADEANWEQP
ncbi:MAG TPA: hypothetical protein VG757_01935 [Devosia sp.]|nr:hypothetical protein [Devosia sp.]